MLCIKEGGGFGGGVKIGGNGFRAIPPPPNDLSHRVAKTICDTTDMLSHANALIKPRACVRGTVINPRVCINVNCIMYTCILCDQKCQLQWYHGPFLI